MPTFSSFFFSLSFLLLLLCLCACASLRRWPPGMTHNTTHNIHTHIHIIMGENTSELRSNASNPRPPPSPPSLLSSSAPLSSSQLLLSETKKKREKEKKKREKTNAKGAVVVKKKKKKKGRREKANMATAQKITEDTRAPGHPGPSSPPPDLSPRVSSVTKCGVFFFSSTNQSTNQPQHNHHLLTLLFFYFRHFFILRSPMIILRMHLFIYRNYIYISFMDYRMYLFLAQRKSIYQQSRMKIAEGLYSS